MSKKNSSFDRLFVCIFWAASGASLFVLGMEFFLSIPEFDIRNLFLSYRALVLLAYTFVVTPLWLIGWFHILRERTIPFSHQIYSLSGRVENFPIQLRWFLSALLAFLPTYIFLFSPLRFDPFTRLSHLISLTTVSLVISFIVSPRLEFSAYLQNSFSCVLLVSAIYLIGLHALTVTSYPFSLTWSEGNRIWDYSILFGANRYAFPNDREIYAFIEPGRQFVWGVPFLFPQVNIAVVRAWDTIVSIFPHLLLAFLLAQTIGRQRPLNRWEKTTLTLWGLLFLSQGPIFPHLILPVFIMILGLSNKNIFVSAILVAVATYFAGTSRFHWGFGFSILAALFSVLQSEWPSASWQHFRRPVVLTASALVGLVTIGLLENQYNPIVPSEISLIAGKAFSRLVGIGNNSPWLVSVSLFLAVFAVLLGTVLFRKRDTNPSRFWTLIGISALAIVILAGGNRLLAYLSTSGSLRQDLLWSRWLPNQTFSPGILLAIAVASAPALLLLFLTYRQGNWKLSSMQIVLSLLALLALWGIGMIASAKIGGGGDLHNLDLFLIAMLLAVSVAWPHMQDVLNGLKEARRVTVAYLLLAAPVLYITFLIPGRPLQLSPDYDIEAALYRIQIEVDAAAPYGDILFMDQRQLLTFGFIQNVFLIDEYEKKRVMDKALSNDQLYFERFYEDLANHRFSLIVSEKLFTRTGNPASPFPDENDAWVKWVTEPLLDYYEPILTINSVGVQLLVPRK